MIVKPTVLIIGLGQDGTLLRDLLLRNSVDVICATRNSILLYHPSSPEIHIPQTLSTTPLLGNPDNIASIFLTIISLKYIIFQLIIAFPV